MTAGPTLGLALSSEEHAPAKLVDIAIDAERAGFAFSLISDHFHPWVPCQGQSPFVWAVLGAIATRTTRPEDFEDLTRDVTEDQVAGAVVCGPDPQKYLAAIYGFEKAGFDHVYVHQVGPDQAGLIGFAKSHLL